MCLIISKGDFLSFAGNLGAIIAIVFALVMGWDNPFTALQLLFINLVNDSLPAIALGMEKRNQLSCKENLEILILASFLVKR